MRIKTQKLPFKDHYGPFELRIGRKRIWLLRKGDHTPTDDAFTPNGQLIQ
jgi:hypothetical protein